jgi:hypothetical protein
LLLIGTFHSASSAVVVVDSQCGALSVAVCETCVTNGRINRDDSRRRVTGGKSGEGSEEKE